MNNVIIEKKPREPKIIELNLNLPFLFDHSETKAKKCLQPIACNTLVYHKYKNKN